MGDKFQFNFMTNKQPTIPFINSPNAFTTGTDRTSQVAVIVAPMFLHSCIKTHPTGEQPSCTRTCIPAKLCSNIPASRSAFKAMQPE